MRASLFGLLAGLASLLTFGAGCASAAPDGEGGGSASDEATPSEPDEGEIASAVTTGPVARIMTYNIKYGAESGLDLRKIAAAITPSNPDLLALQEVDEMTNRSNRQHETDELSRLTNMPYRYFAPNFAYDGGQYGLAILSKYPLTNTRVIRLDTRTERAGGYEPRIAAMADVSINGRPVTFVTVHASLHEEERDDNARAILAALGGKARQAIVTGDMNERPGNSIGDAFGDAGFDDAFRDRHRFSFGFTSPAVFPTKRIDYIYKGETFGKTTHAWVPSTTASDHRPLAATVLLR